VVLLQEKSTQYPKQHLLDAPNAPMHAEDEQSQVRQGSFATGSNYSENEIACLFPEGKEI